MRREAMRMGLLGAAIVWALWAATGLGGKTLAADSSGRVAGAALGPTPVLLVGIFLAGACLLPASILHARPMRWPRRLAALAGGALVAACAATLLRGFVDAPLPAARARAWLTLAGGGSTTYAVPDGVGSVTVPLASSLAFWGLLLLAALLFTLSAREQRSS